MIVNPETKDADLLGKKVWHYDSVNDILKEYTIVTVVRYNGEIHSVEVEEGMYKRLFQLTEVADNLNDPHLLQLYKRFGGNSIDALDKVIRSTEKELEECKAKRDDFNRRQAEKSFDALQTLVRQFPTVEDFFNDRVNTAYGSHSAKASQLANALYSTTTLSYRDSRRIAGLENHLVTLKAARDLLERMNGKH